MLCAGDCLLEGAPCSCYAPWQLGSMWHLETPIWADASAAFVSMAIPPQLNSCLALQESEYAAWVLCNGYNLNHTTVAVHKLEHMR